MPNVLETIRYRAPLQGGGYIAVIADLPKPREINDRGRIGVNFTIKVVEGDAKGRMAALELLVQADRGQRRVDRDLDVLSVWSSVLSVDSAGSLVELMEKLKQAAVGKRVEFTLQRNEWGGGIDTVITAVRVMPDV